MDTRIFYILFIELILFILVILGLLFVINSESDECGCVCNGNAGETQSFEVSHGKTNFYQPTKRVSERYDDKLFEYLEHIQEQRDKTFMRGKVFLKEK